MKCPKCESARLLPLEIGEILLDRCEACAGIWFDHGELEAVVGTGAAAHLDPLERPSDRPRSGPCPRCAVEMRPVAAAQDPARPVPVDRCPSCMGLWLDRRQVQSIEDQRLPIAIHRLFVSDETDRSVVGALPPDERDLVLRVAERLCRHPQRNALLSFLERDPDAPEADPCGDGGP